MMVFLDTRKRWPAGHSAAVGQNERQGVWKRACYVQVLHLAEDCISKEGVQEALKRCRQAGKVGDLLTALRALTYRLDSGRATSISVTLQDRSASPLLLAVSTPGESPGVGLALDLNDGLAAAARYLGLVGALLLC